MPGRWSKKKKTPKSTPASSRSRAAPRASSQRSFSNFTKKFRFSRRNQQAVHQAQQHGGNQAATRVAQATQARAQPPSTTTETPQLQSSGPEQTQVADDAASPPAPPQPAPVPPPTPGQLKAARVDAETKDRYDREALGFELTLGRILKDAPEANAAAEDLVEAIHRVVDAWAAATGRNIGRVYEEAFAHKPADTFYGAFQMSAYNIASLFQNARQKPLRTKLKLVYNAILNNNLAKWLKTAAEVLHTQAAVVVKEQKPGKADFRDVEVGADFAARAGLDALTADERAAIRDQTTADVTRYHANDARHRLWHGRGELSSVMSPTALVQASDAQRDKGVSAGVSFPLQRTLYVGDVDLTREERTQVATGGQRWKLDRADAKIPWSQGSAHIEVRPEFATGIAAHLEAGISTSADLMFHAARHFHFSPQQMKGMRLAMLGWMLPNRDHSFYEIMKAGTGYGLPFVFDANDPGAEYEHAAHYAPMQWATLTNKLQTEAQPFPRWVFEVAAQADILAALSAPDQTPDAMRQGFRARSIEVPDDATAEHLAAIEVVDADIKRTVEGTWSRHDTSVLKLSEISRRPAALALRVRSQAAYDALVETLVREYAAPVLIARGAPDASVLDGARSDDMLRYVELAYMLSTTPFSTGAAANRAQNHTLLREIARGDAAERIFVVDRAGFIAFATPILTRRDPELESLFFDAAWTSSAYDLDFVQTGIPDVIGETISERAFKQLRKLAAAIAARGAGPMDDAAFDELMVTAKRLPVGHSSKTMIVAALALNAGATFTPGSRAFEYAMLSRALGGSRIPLGEADMRAWLDLTVQDEPQGQHGGDLDLDFDYGDDDGGGFGAVESAWERELSWADAVWDGTLQESRLRRDERPEFTALNDAERYAIFKYTGADGDGPIQQAMNTPNIASSPDGSIDRTRGLGRYGALAAIATSGLAKLPAAQAPVFNGQAATVIDEGSAQPLLDAHPVGKMLRQRTFLSTSAAFDTSYGARAGYDLVWRIETVKTGREVTLLSSNPREREILFAPGARFQVTGSEYVPRSSPRPEAGKVVIRLREV